MGEMFEPIFEAIGLYAGRNPWVMILITAVIGIGCSMGWMMLETESRPDKQWVPAGAVALEHNEYVTGNWPSAQRFNLWIAECKGSGCNAWDAKHLQRLNELHQKILAIEIDSAAVKKLDDYKKVDQGEWDALYAGKWSFDRREGTNRKCYLFGPFCASQSILTVFREDKAVIDALTDENALLAINAWETQTNACPVTLARPDSPCVDASRWLPAAAANDCQTYKTAQQRQNCRDSATNYCASVCPTQCVTPPGASACVPSVRAGATCADNGCLSLEVFSGLGNNTGSGGNNSAPDSAFAFEPFKLKTVASGASGKLEKNGDGKYSSAKALFGFYALGENVLLVDGDNVDPIAEAWEEEALCVLGIKSARSELSKDCPEDSLFTFSAQFDRSLGDEFGAAIVGDLAALGIAYVLILVYMAVMLSRRDHVHSMLGMSIVTVLIVLLSFAGCIGFGAYLGQKNNNLNNNIPFLLLGLGVDDAFVLSAEFFRAQRENPGASIEERVMLAAKYGGVSILITSVTDALAFLIGSATVLPALSWFCVFAGIGVILCFIFQLTLFLPCLALNAARAEDNRYDLFCCIKASEEHKYDEPKGCCYCCTCRPGILESAMENYATLLLTPIGKAITLAGVVGIAAAGVVGCTLIYKDFKLEWFIPSDSYVYRFFRANEKYFESGVPFNVYTRSVDHFANQGNFAALGTYLETNKFMDTSESVNDWFGAFISASNSSSTASLGLNADRTAFVDESTFYRELHSWYVGGGGARFRTNMQWKDADCESEKVWETAACDPTAGLKGSRMGATLKLEYTDKGIDRYNTMTQLREDIEKIVPGDSSGGASFPYSFQFLYWEEVGIIDQELIRNISICGAVVCVIVALMIPVPRIAIWVILAIVLSVVDLIGFLYWWGVTISSVSTIYVLISVGLAVDYSAHIAHMFVTSTGTADERALKALVRIGPCVFNAVMSTLLAVFVLFFSKSYIFRVFAIALCLVVTFGGGHGLIALPVFLALFGGENHVEEGKEVDHEAPVDIEMPAGKGKVSPLASDNEGEEGERAMQA